MRVKILNKTAYKSLQRLLEMGQHKKKQTGLKSVLSKRINSFAKRQTCYSTEPMKTHAVIK